MSGLFVATGDAKVATSSDGITWTQGTAVAGESWGRVAWSPTLGLFCAVGYTDSGLNPRIYTSPDGLTWTARTSGWGAGEYLTDVCWDVTNGLFLAVGNRTNSILTSPDGITWTNRAAGNTARLLTLASGGSAGLIATGDAEYLTSTNGTAWTLCTRPHASAGRSVAYSPSLALWCMGGYTDNKIYTSTNGASGTWTGRTTSFTTLVDCIRWSVALGLFVAVGNSGELETSTNGTAWTARTSNLGSNNVPDVVWAPELTLFVAVAAAGNLATSPDGTTWTARTSSFSSTDVLGVAWAPTLGAAVRTHQMIV